MSRGPTDSPDVSGAQTQTQKKGNTHLTTICRHLMSLSLYLIQSQQETHPLYIYFPAFCEFRTVILVLRHVPSPRSCSSSCHRMPQSMLTSAGQTNNDSQSHWQSDLLRLRQDAVLSRGISLLQLITQLMFVAVSDFIYFNPLPVQTVLS